ncbi:MAG: flagellar motor switch protein FliN [Acetobacter orientalis]|uniref:Flagellar motor switch protein FliN n=1 Tax=Acetobacter orientalis TaxID=146474 RepID=A0A2Z5ZEY9_9PROT|nr:flagellar motor switch protein FliN [Acetobacter orientalis]MDN6040482.1 flagellar motor switch protein FliN [Acetobacter sp.]MCP1216586.1 flagellar motor switch protein FliN [Acetobacter orientalis]MCP1219658.1 flagellar motor switch protein FliN [Acetobacter orientalis]BBC78949.1 flagellar motor switch protein FliN [Acetobacter orientalis]GAN66232.1 flagellar motor switch protein FliN [Acetobacter orientalis]
MSTENNGIGLEDFATSAAEQAAPAAPSAEAGEQDAKVNAASEQMEAMYEIPVKITAIIGTATMPVNQLLKLGRGAVVELDRKLGEAVDIYANNRLIARGEVVVVDDNHIGVTMTEILSSSPAAS